MAVIGTGQAMAHVVCCMLLVLDMVPQFPLICQ